MFFFYFDFETRFFKNFAHRIALQIFVWVKKDIIYQDIYIFKTDKMVRWMWLGRQAENPSKTVIFYFNMLIKQLKIYFLHIFPYCLDALHVLVYDYEKNAGCL